MKEEDAKKKLCPIPFLSGKKVDHMAAFNGERDNCVSSACMMWEASKRKESVNLMGDEKPDGEGWEVTASYLSAESNQNSTTWTRYADAGYGDCGLKSKCNAYRSVPS